MLLSGPTISLLKAFESFIGGRNKLLRMLFLAVGIPGGVVIERLVGRLASHNGWICQLEH
ncbi:hypothetical protein KDW_45920 [Dictyobacter vulcani]|uniref:Uncharacterized protein n=1 Tax=Dictyobacter vulcani TaxID=2607529 RepID=A0A5J4KV99_9CHLR|nr:hypothetical protein KDW_45920 [Dictyobacter vulcani]